MAIPSYNAEAEEARDRRVWRIVAHSPLQSLWNLQGSTVKEIAQRTMKSLTEDRIFGRAAELGFYFFFSVFPALFCATAIVGLEAKSAHQFYDSLLNYLALVVPHSALKMVLQTFNQTAKASGSGKITLSFLGAVWSASIGISAIQDTLNDVYKIPDSRSYLGARIKAIGLTFVVGLMITVSLGSMFLGDFVAKAAAEDFAGSGSRLFVSVCIRSGAWAVATLLLILVFAVIYYWAPDWRRRRWRWITPGSVIGIIGWLIASVGFRMYLKYFNTYATTYGSLGAVIVLLMWFYITGLVLLAGGEINSEIEAAAVEKRLPRRSRGNRKSKHAA